MTIGCEICAEESHGGWRQAFVFIGEHAYCHFHAIKIEILKRLNPLWYGEDYAGACLP